MTKHKKIKLKISYEVESVLDPALFEEGATEQGMIDAELESARELFIQEMLEAGIENGSYTVDWEFAGEQNKGEQND